MHEFGVTQAAFEAALENAEQSGAARITDVHLLVGTITSIEPDSIRMYWDEISEGSIAEAAILHFRHTPTEALCSDCNHRFINETESPICPACAGNRVLAVDDEYLALEAIDIEKVRVESSLE